MFCYALLVQQGLHDSALAAGAGLAPMAATFLLASLSTSRLLRRFGTRVLAAGAILQAIGLVILAGAVPGDLAARVAGLARRPAWRSPGWARAW